MINKWKKQWLNKRIFFNFCDTKLNVAHNIDLDSHHTIQTKSETIIYPNYWEIDKIDVNMIVKNAYYICRIKKQNQFEYERVFSARFGEQDEDDQIVGKIELHNILKVNQNLSQSDYDKIDIRSYLERQTQNQNEKLVDGYLMKTISMTKSFNKTTETNGSTYVRIPKRSSTISCSGNDDEYCFFRSFLPHLLPCDIGRPYRVANCTQSFKGLYIDGFVLSNGFNCSDVHNFWKNYP